MWPDFWDAIYIYIYIDIIFCTTLDVVFYCIGVYNNSDLLFLCVVACPVSSTTLASTASSTAPVTCQPCAPIPREEPSQAGLPSTVLPTPEG